MIKTKTYDCGLKLIVDEMANFESVAFHILVKTGSINEDETNYGISHYIEHMLFKGTKTRSASDIVKQLDAVGANVNAYTDKTETVYYTKSTGDNLEACVDILCDMLLNSTFDLKEMAREKKVVLEEISMYADDAYSSSEILANKAFYNGTPYSFDVAGSKQSVKRIKREDILAYLSKFYTANNIVVSFAGNITFEKADILLEKYLIPFLTKNDNPPSALKTYAPQIANKQIKKFKDNEQSHICISYKGTTPDDAILTTYKLFNIAWGGGMSSKLFQRIREKLGLVYSINCGLYANYAGGDTTIHLATTDKNVKIALKAIREEIDFIVKNGLSEQEFNIAKNYYISSLKLAYENTSAVSLTNAKKLAYLNKTVTKQEFINEVSQITLEAVNNIIKRIYSNDNFTISYVGRNTKVDLLKYFQ